MIKKIKNKELFNNWSIDQVDLEFLITDNTALVTSHLICKKINKKATDIELIGKNIDLLKIYVADKEISRQTYEINKDQLVIKNLTKNDFVITIQSKISLLSAKKTGLFLADKKIFTLNDKDSFHRITYFLDNHDAVVLFSCKITATKDKFMHLLSDGKIVDKGENKDTHWVLWKSSCLRPVNQFSLVAGKFAVLKTKVLLGTKSIEVSFYVPEVYKDYCDYALDCINRIMQFDYSLLKKTYYTSSYSIVALKNYSEKFIEGKELNIFDITSIASSASTTTDLEYIKIDKKLAKKFFYIYHKEKIAKQNWFYYALCQGFGFLRLQEYLFYRYGKSFQKIEYVKEYQKLQNTDCKQSLAPAQFFSEHANYFCDYYRVEQILQMLALNIEKATFCEYLREYLNQSKKKIASLENFIGFMQSACKKKLKNFDLWFTEDKIPKIKILDYYDKTQRIYKLFLFQVDQNKITTDKQEYWDNFLKTNIDKDPEFTANTEDVQTEKFDLQDIISKLPLLEQAFPINFNILLHYKNNENLLSDSERNKKPNVIELKKNYDSFVYDDTPNLLPALNHDFVAPVDMEYEYSHNELINLSYNEDDKYIYWKAHHILFLSIFEEQLARYLKDKVVYTDNNFIISFQKIITNSSINNSLIYQIINLPTQEELFFEASDKNTDSTHYVRNYLLKSLSSKLLNNFINLYQKNSSEFKFSLDNKELFKRMIRNSCLLFIAYSKEKDLLMDQFENAHHFNDTMGVLKAFNNIDCEQREQVMSETLKKWQKDQSLLAKWFQLQASSNYFGAINNIEQIAQHPLLSYKKPKLISSFFYAFAFCNFYCLHHISGRGYELLKNFIIKIDKIDGDIACDLIVAFKKEASFSLIKENNKKKCLEDILSTTSSRKLSKIAKDLISND